MVCLDCDQSVEGRECEVTGCGWCWCWWQQCWRAAAGEEWCLGMIIVVVVLTILALFETAWGGQLLRLVTQGCLNMAWIATWKLWLPYSGATFSDSEMLSRTGMMFPMRRHIAIPSANLVAAHGHMCRCHQSWFYTMKVDITRGSKR